MGTSREGDAAYKSRYGDRTANSSEGAVDAIKSALIEAGADDVRVEENDSDVVETVQGFDLRPHSVLCVVRGGTDAGMASAVLRAKGMGVTPMTAHIGGAHSNVATLMGAAAAFEWAGERFTNLDLSGAADLAAVADAVQTEIRTSTTALIDQTQVFYQWHMEGNFVVGFPWRPNREPEFDAGAMATALGLSPALDVASPGPFIRARPRNLTVAGNVTIDRRTFPSDGLITMRQRLIDRVGKYGIGNRPWENDLLCELEAVPGTQVSAFSATDEGTAINAVIMPLDAYYVLPLANITLTLTEA